MDTNFALETEARLFWTPFWLKDGAVSKHFEDAGRALCGHHVKALVENAEGEVLAYASRHKVSGHSPSEVNGYAVSLFGAFATDKRSVAAQWPSLAREVLERELDRAGQALGSALNAQIAGAASPSALVRNASRLGFDAPQPEWLELWQGPLRFRATYDKGQFGPGHTIERINQYGADGASGGGRHQPIYSVRVDDDDGSVVIEWLVGWSGQQPPFQTVRYYEGGPGRGRYDRLRDDPTARDQELQHLPPEHRQRAVGAYACAVSMREWIEQEFRQAVHAGDCEIWARIGSKVAPFNRVPSDVFKAYTIKSWGYGAPGGAWAELDGEPSLFSIHVADNRSLPELVGEQSMRTDLSVFAGGITYVDENGVPVPTIGMVSPLEDSCDTLRPPPDSREKPPRLSDGLLMKWWGRLSDSDRQKPHVDLNEMCRAAFPANSISRQRVRDLDPGRKRGPKPLSGNRTA